MGNASLLNSPSIDFSYEKLSRSMKDKEINESIESIKKFVDSSFKIQEEQKEQIESLKQKVADQKKSISGQLKPTDY